MNRPTPCQTMQLRHLLTVGALLVTLIGSADALPRFSLLSGTRCSACHFTPHGGGLRTELGWGAMDKVGLIRWSADESAADPFSSGASDGSELFTDPDAAAADGAVSPDTLGTTEGGLADALPAHEETSEEPTNSLFDGLLTVGGDVRLQVAKIGRPPEDRRMVLPMQTNVYAALSPVEWISVFGGYNFSTLKHRYNGQSAWEATVLLQPEPTLPTLRVGYIQPSIGIRQDDHTMFMRRDAAETGIPLIPAGYAEIGAELGYEGIHWLTVNAGVYNARNLSDIDPSIGVTSFTDLSSPSLLGRVMLWPQHLDLGFNGELGASWFGNGDFQMMNLFGGLGLSDRASFFVEALLARNSQDRRVRNVSVIGTYHLATWLSLDWRYEWAQTEYPAKELYHSHSAVFGFEFFPLPFIELRPEYRITQREPFGEIGGYIQGQYAIQLHLFY